MLENDVPPPLVSVVIPSFNRKDSMLDLLRDVTQQVGASFEVIVVDDVSNDDSVDKILSKFPMVRLFVNEENGGPAVTRNRGIREAKGSIIVGFDSDVTVPDKKCLHKVSQTLAANPDVDGLAFRLLQPDGKTDDFARWWHPVPVEGYANKCFYTSYFSGTGYAFRSEALKKAGMYPEILYMHYEEEELALRLLDQGSHIIYCPDIEVIHHEGQVSRRSEIKTFYKHRNQVLLAIACMPLGRAVAYLVPRLSYALLNAIRGGYVRTFVKMLTSAWELGKIRWKNDRKPLSRETYRLIAALKNGKLRHNFTVGN